MQQLAAAAQMEAKAGPAEQPRATPSTLQIDDNKKRVMHLANGRSEDNKSFGDDDYEKRFGNTTQKFERGANWLNNLTKDVVGSSKKFFRSTGELVSDGIGKTKKNPGLFSAVSIAIGAVFGVFGLKNAVKTLKSMVNPKSEPVLSWPVIGFESLLQFGAMAGLLATPFGFKNIFTETINGEQVVRMRRLWGAVTAAVLVPLVTAIAKGSSPFVKIPIIGKPLKEVATDLFGGIRNVTTPGEAAAGQGGIATPGQIPNLNPN